MAKETKQLNLYQKLIEIRKLVEYVQDDADGHKFKYASDTAIIGLIRPKMDELGVYLDQEVVDCQVIPYQVHNKSGSFNTSATKVSILYRWIDAENPESVIERRQVMIDPDVSEQGIGKALTYGMRYFLYKSLVVPTASDDPDLHRQKIENKKPKPLITNEQAKEIEALIGKDEALKTRVLAACGVKLISQITADRYPFIIKGLNAEKQKVKDNESN